MKKFNVQITYTGMIEETIEAESLDEAELRLMILREWKCHLIVMNLKLM
ncbi:TPA: hypothetical protein PED31_002035 [Staphylococcus aureus]|nr:hypothetical protein [Staphylococcus aureus]HDE6842443.1 hypothetical protein [Staphylococcus aureus]HDE6898010.1 hypothetical protein [Staphylococcus aureus]HDE6900629.1 hypothetical protein [Staphylococcus aureus]HDE7034162.1 hypothetical protein [Staphylococcus aureus]